MLSLMTKHFGEMQIDEREVIFFPEGLPGFEDRHKYALIRKGETPEPFLWLQCVEDPDMALVVVDPFAIYSDYTVDVADEELAVLGEMNPERIMTLCIVVIPEDVKQMRVNLKAPLLINLETNAGKQVLQHNENLPIRYFLLQ